MPQRLESCRTLRFGSLVMNVLNDVFGTIKYRIFQRFNTKNISFSDLFFVTLKKCLKDGNE